MKAIVLIKATPDTETRITVSADGKSIPMNDVKLVINPYDEYAVEESLKFKAKNPGTEVVVMCLGSESARELMLKAMAMGADRATLIDNTGLETADSLTVAKILAAAIKTESADVVFCGKQAIDDDNMHVGVMTAELLGWPHVNNIKKLDQNGPKITVEREIEGGQVEVFEATLPALFGCHKALNTPRYASLPGIMQAKKKPFAKKTPADLGVANAAAGVKVTVAGYTLPPPRAAGKVFAGEPIDAMVDKLVKALREEAKVI